MAVDLKKTVKRVSSDLVREAGKIRQIVVSLEPPCLLGFRAKGCRKTYYLTAEVCYSLAVKAHVLDQKKQKAKERKQNRKTNRKTKRCRKNVITMASEV